MLHNLFNKIERVLSLGSTGPWWWRLLGSAISLALLVAVLIILRH